MNQNNYTVHQLRLSGPGASGSWLGQAIRMLAFVGLLILGLTFSVVVFAVVAVAGLGAWAYIWWKTRKVRRAIREQQQAASHGYAYEAPRQAAAAGKWQAAHEEVSDVSWEDVPRK